MLIESEKETPGDRAGDTAAVVVRPRRIKRPVWNVVTETADKVISTAAASILKPTQRSDGTLTKAVKIRDGWVPEDKVEIYRHPHFEVQIELSHVLESIESIHFF